MAVAIRSLRLGIGIRVGLTFTPGARRFFFSKRGGWEEHGKRCRVCFFFFLFSFVCDRISSLQRIRIDVAQ